MPQQPGYRNASQTKFEKAHPPVRVLVPVDGLPVSNRAVEYVVAGATEGLEVYLLNVQPMLTGDELNYLMSAGVTAHSRHLAGQEALQAAKALLDKKCVSYEAIVVLGFPAKSILRYAVERDCTEIVLGTKETTADGRIRTRSVADRVARLAQVPVVLIDESGKVRRRSAVAKRANAQTE
jgi:nucleotide-binding universal stress UspA family protein